MHSPQYLMICCIPRALVRVDLRFQHADVGDVAVVLAVVETVAHHKFVWHLKAGEIGVNGLGAAGGLIQQRNNGDGSRALGEEVVL